MAFATHTEVDGTFRFDSLPAEIVQASLHVETPEPPAAPATDEPRTPRTVRAPALRSPDLGRSLDLDLRTLPLLTLRVQGVDAGPARHARVLLLPVTAVAQQSDSTVFAVALDELGEARLHVQAGRWSVFVCDGTGYAHQLTTIERAEDRKLQLQKLAAVRGMVRAADGTAASGATFYVNSMVSGGGRDDESQALSAIGLRVNQWLAGRTAPASDGSFVLPFLDVPRVRFEGGAMIGSCYARMPLQTGDKPVEIELGDPRRR